MTSDLLNGNGHNGDDVLSQIEALAAEATVEPADQLTASKVQRLVDQAIDYSGIARQAVLDALRALIGHLPAEERDRLNLYPLFKPPNQPKQVGNFLASCPAPPGTPVFQPKKFSDLLAQPAKQWLVDQVIGVGDAVTWYGPSGGGKTFTIVDLIVCACWGKTWAMRFDIPRPLSVAYCAGEGLSGLPQRFAAAAQHHGVDDLPNFTFFDSAPQLFTPDRDNNPTAETIGRFVQEWQQRQTSGQAGELDLLIIDTLHSATVGAEENAAADMGRVLNAVKAAIRQLGCAVLLVHHSNKAGTGERGSSALRGAMDTMVEIKPTAGKFAMTCEKLKDAPAWKPQTFSLVELGDSARVWWDTPSEDNAGAGQKAADKDALLAELRRYPNQRFTAKQLAEVIAKSDNYCRNLLAELEKTGDCKRELSDPAKEASPRNPWVYSLKIAHHDHNPE